MCGVYFFVIYNFNKWPIYLYGGVVLFTGGRQTDINIFGIQYSQEFKNNHCICCNTCKSFICISLILQSINIHIYNAKVLVYPGNNNSSVNKTTNTPNEIPGVGTDEKDIRVSLYSDSCKVSLNPENINFCKYHISVNMVHNNVIDLLSCKAVKRLVIHISHPSEVLPIFNCIHIVLRSLLLWF